jgi:hypothetical protein
MDEELEKLIKETAAETRRLFDTTTADPRRPFDVTAAEHICNVFNERLDQLTSDINSEFAENRATFRISYFDLDRRLRSLEERVERLESSSARTQ